MAVGVGLSVGATNLAAVVVGSEAVLRTPVLTRYPNRPPEIGVPSENPKLQEPGLTISDFVDRVGDPVGIVAADGSAHRGEAVLADALRALTFTLAGERSLSDRVAVTHPAHWPWAAVSALRGALAKVPEFSSGPEPVPLLSDAAAVITALQSDPGLPSRGVIALCDFGGSGTSITLVDAANGYQPIGPTVRDTDFAGNMIDQALLKHVIADMSTGGMDLSGTSAINSLSQLRQQCRAAKEQLSTNTVTALPADLPGLRSEIRVTRAELDDEIRGPLSGFIRALYETMERNGVRGADLVAVATAGGGARVPIVTTTLSEHLRLPVVTTGRPELTAATGGGLRAARGPADDSGTSMSPATPAALLAEPDAGETQAFSTSPSLAWSAAADVPDVVPGEQYDYAGQAVEPGVTDARPEVQFHHDPAGSDAAAPMPWYRRPVTLMVGGVAAVLAAVLAVVLLVPGGGNYAQAGEIFLESTNVAGADPFSPTAATPQPPAANPGPDPAGAPASEGVRTASGETPGLYGGTRNLTTCDAELLISFLGQNPAQARAWASVFRITPEQIPAFVRELTPVLLRTDTRVTNHGFVNGQATPRQAVLEAGTAVLVDRLGAPRVRCYCGNPLLAPVAVPVKPSYSGARWSTFAEDRIVVVQPTSQTINNFTLYDPATGRFFGRPRGGTGATDTDDPRTINVSIQPPPQQPPVQPQPPRSRPVTTQAPPPVIRATTQAPPPTTTVQPPTTTVPPTTTHDMGPSNDLYPPLYPPTTTVYNPPSFEPVYDTDLDGVSDAAEYIAGTDPLDPHDY